ncbi:MAG: hypothetical protein K2Y27_16325 [Xanthobacteraceae bacterium]|nr:hypothetical protein [Xanthobacteraceae bacterium]
MSDRKPNPRQNPFAIQFFSPSCTVAELVRFYTPLQRREWWRWKALWRFQVRIGHHRRLRRPDRSPLTEIAADTERLEADGEQRELETWLAALTVEGQPSADELAVASVIEAWRWSLTDTAGLYVRGLVDGNDYTTGALVEIDRRRTWVRAKDGRLWRLGEM